jgi:hypothetical protein
MVKIHTVLLVVCAVAALACAALSVPLLTASAPESCRGCPVADPAALPSPTGRPAATRAATQQHCLIGSWRTVDETMNIKFYTDVDPYPFTTSGRYYEFHPDGTAVERNDNVQFVGNHRGVETRVVANGWREFTWSATDSTITFVAITGADLTWSYYDQRGLLNSLPEQVDPQRNENKNYTCAGAQLVETGDNGYRSVWQRTADYGAYG